MKGGPCLTIFQFLKYEISIGLGMYHRLLSLAIQRSPYVNTACVRQQPKNVFQNFHEFRGEILIQQMIDD
jgi:hypothetical protein